jgi:tryptophan synthase alpha chain
LPENLLSEIEALKNDISKPLVVGFGISNPSQAAKIASVSDGIVIGSAIVNFISRIESGQASDDDLSSFVSSVREQMDKI